MGLGSIIGAIAPAVIGGLFSSKGQASANEATAASTAAQIDFQRESAQKSYQWATADMRAAGINPMLAYQQGGSNALSGASYTAQNELAGLAGGIQEGVNSGLALRRQNQELKNMKADVKLKDQQRHLSLDDQKVRGSQDELLIQNRRLAAAQTKKTQAEARIAEFNTNSARTAATIAKQDEQFYRSRFGKILRWIDRTGTSLNPLTKATK